MQTQGQQILARAAAWAAQHRTAASRPARPKPQEAAVHVVARQIADDMLDVAAVRGCCEEEDLLGRGWTPDALRRHGVKAREIANAASVRSI
ncbi:hypothetical protein [Aureimonas sp. AU40]|uniref:hypothetical protein n=1 Tax=Aureimonas sp. AU40 TaxID=1637747 RepID=UPI00078085AC|nr:hypothetical protein [Aureimonas sp. AU40]